MRLPLIKRGINPSDRTPKRLRQVPLSKLGELNDIGPLQRALCNFPLLFSLFLSLGSLSSHLHFSNDTEPLRNTQINGDTQYSSM